MLELRDFYFEPKKCLERIQIPIVTVSTAVAGFASMLGHKYILRYQCRYLSFVHAVEFDSAIKPKSFQDHVFVVLGWSNLQETETVIAAFGYGTAFDFTFTSVHYAVVIFVSGSGHNMTPSLQDRLGYLLESFALAFGWQSFEIGEWTREPSRIDIVFGQQFYG